MDVFKPIDSSHNRLRSAHAFHVFGLGWVNQKNTLTELNSSLKLKCRFISVFCISVMLKSRMYSERYSTFTGTTAPPKGKNRTVGDVRCRSRDCGLKGARGRVSFVDLAFGATEI